MERTGVLLVGHGVPATDCPPELVGQLMGLQWGPGGHHGGDGSGSLQQRALELDGKIRNWPRRPGNDPYKEGLERLAEVLKPLLSADLFAVAYNEFCAPSVPEGLEDLIRRGATRILVIPSMVTPGGVHSEMDIPRAIEGVRARHREVTLQYVWPFDLNEVAELLASHLERSREP